MVVIPRAKPDPPTLACHSGASPRPPLAKCASWEPRRGSQEGGLKISRGAQTPPEILQAAALGQKGASQAGLPLARSKPRGETTDRVTGPNPELSCASREPPRATEGKGSRSPPFALPSLRVRGLPPVSFFAQGEETRRPQFFAASTTNIEVQPARQDGEQANGQLPGRMKAMEGA